jgi:hypothetical protein
MASAIIKAFMVAKFDDPAASRALYAVSAELSGSAVVTRLSLRAQLAVCDMLATARDRTFADPSLVAFVLTTTLVGPVQMLLETRATPAQVVVIRLQLTIMTVAYLRAAARMG